MKKLESLIMTDDEVVLSFTQSIISLEKEKRGIEKRLNWFKQERQKLLVKQSK